MNSQDNRMKMTNYRWTICLMLFIATTIKLYGPTGPFSDMEGFHCSGI